jgi:hypothetical protein
VREDLFARAVFWLGVAGLLWMAIRTIFMPLRVWT